jgi:hypothetical protein
MQESFSRGKEGQLRQQREPLQLTSRLRQSNGMRNTRGACNSSSKIPGRGRLVYVFFAFLLAFLLAVLVQSSQSQ